MPEWGKILISAIAGAVFGFVSNMVAEYIKGERAAKKIKIEAAQQLSDELTENLDVITSHWKYLSSDDEFTAHDDADEIVTRTLVALSQISRDRFVHYFEDHKAVLYALDDNKNLRSFYESVRLLQWFVEMRKMEGIIATTASAKTQGTSFLSEMGIVYRSKPTMSEKILELEKKGILPRRQKSEPPPEAAKPQEPPVIG